MPDITTFVPGFPPNWHLDIVYRPIRHIYFRVYPENRTVRISAPFRINPVDFQRAVRAKSKWLIKKMVEPEAKQMHFRPVSAMRNDVSCTVWGQMQPVKYQAGAGRPKVHLDAESGIIVKTPPAFNPGKKQGVLEQWLRSQLMTRIAALMGTWVPAMGVAVAEFRVKKMKTRWGSCNISAKRIWINTVLVHLPVEFLEYVLVHELAHLLEPGHNQRFYKIVGTHLPDWKQRKNGLDGIDLRN